MNQPEWEKEQPKVSIITVCLNSAQTIEDTIKSVLRQTYPNIEYIIIDGGSTDGTVDIINKYAEGIDKWCSEADEGIYDAMNKGIRLAAGEIVGILNADDWYPEDAVDLAVEIFKQNKGMNFVHGGVLFSNRTGEVMFQHIPNEKYLIHPTMFVRAAVYRQQGYFDTRFPVYADKLLYLQNLESGIHFYTEQVLYYMRDGGVSSIRSMRNIRELFLIRKMTGSNLLANFKISTKELTFPALRFMLELLGARRLMQRYNHLTHNGKIAYNERIKNIQE